MQKKKDLILITAGLLIVVVIGIFYIKFVERKINEESTNHLYEIFDQIDSEFESLAEHNWKLLSDWNIYIRHILDNNEIEKLQKFLENGRVQRKFKDFYFLDQEGNYRTLSGDQGCLELGEQQEMLFEEKKNVVIDGRTSNGEEMLIFAIFVDTGEYEGFSYSAIALSYSNEDMVQLLDVSAFSNQAKCFVTYPDGGIIFSTNNEGVNQYNFLDMLETKVILKGAEVEQVEQEIQEGKTGTVQYQKEGKIYYLTYIPVGFQGWTLFGSVPKNVVNASMNLIQQVTVAIVAGIFILIATGILLYYQRMNKRKLRNMDVKLWYREQLFAMLVENSTDIYAMFSARDYKVEYISPNVERLLGIPVEDILKDIKALGRSHINDIGFSWKDMDAIEPGESRQAERARINAKTGEQRWYKEKLYRANIEGNSKFLLVMMDCTDDKKLRFQLEQALHIAKVANEAKSSFLSNMSHDIRTPMNAIIGFSYLLVREADNSKKVRDYANKISSSGHHLLGLINDILDMSKIESGKTTLTIQVFDLPDLLEDLNTIIQPLANAKMQKFEVHVAGMQEEKFLGDVMKVKQILLNLLSNAVKYTQEKGWICFSISLLEKNERGNFHLRFEVSDNGIGMSSEYMEKIFEPFTREKDSMVDSAQGTGLGMAITKNLIDLMGGTISVVSEKGKGSTFVIDLEFPAVTGKTEDSLQEEKNIQDLLPVQERKMAGMRFLVAEDNEINAEIIQEFLTVEGAKCDIAVNGKEALDLFEKSDQDYYQGILMDIRMPVMMGTEAAKKIRNSTHPQAKTIKIIAMTANAFPEDVEHTMASGMDAHLSKPVDMKTLWDTINNLI